MVKDSIVTSGESHQVACPHCGKANDLTGDSLEKWDKFLCYHCERSCMVVSVETKTIFLVQGLETYGS